MENYRDVIKSPIITEKSSELAQNNNTMTFSVDTKANKTQIKQAIEKVFNVKVDSVNTINVKPKKKKIKHLQVYKDVLKEVSTKDTGIYEYNDSFIRKLLEPYEQIDLKAQEVSI